MKRCRSIVTAVVLALLFLPAIASASWYTDCKAKVPPGATCRVQYDSISVCCRQTYDSCHEAGCLSAFLSCSSTNAQKYSECPHAFAPPADDKARDAWIATLTAIELLKLTAPVDEKQALNPEAVD